MIAFQNSINLEKPNLLSLVTNKPIAWFMNNYPNLTNKIGSLSKQDLAYYVFHDDNCPSGSYKQLNAIYDFETNQEVDLINRLLNVSPALKAARNRKKLAQHLLKKALSGSDNKPLSIFSFGGGDERLSLEVMAEVKKKNVYLISIDSQAVAKTDGQKRAQELDLNNQACFITEFNDSNKYTMLRDFLLTASEILKVQLSEINAVMAHGFLEYLDLNKNTNTEFSSFLNNSIKFGSRDLKLILSQTDLHDRVPYYEKGQNLFMRLRGKDELKREIEMQDLRIEYMEKEPMNIITMMYCSKL